MATKEIVDLNPTSVANNTDLMLMRQGVEDRQVQVQVIRDRGSLLGQTLAVGEFGYGGVAKAITDYYAGNDANLIDRSGLFLSDLSTLNSPEVGTINHIQVVSGSIATQILVSTDTNNLYFRRRKTTWMAWEKPLKSSQNLADLADVPTARTNLDVYGKSETYTKAEMDGRYLQRANNFSDLSNVVTARTNLGVYAKTETYTRTEMDGRYLQKTNNLSDLANVTTARTNLGLGTAALVNTGTAAANVPTITQADARYLKQASNLSDLPNKGTSRTNLDVFSKAETTSLVQSVYPVGAIFISTVPTNPATLFGFGTWQAIAQGRTLIGAGQGIDDNAFGKTFTAGTTGGEYTHGLTEAEMPEHTHSATVTDNGHSHSGVAVSGSARGDANGSPNWSTYGNTATAFTGIAVTIGPKGSGSKHNNIQPYLVTYIWERIA